MQIQLYGIDQDIDPPDTQLAAGPTSLAEALNSTLSIWSKSGNMIGSYDLNTFFTLPPGFRFTDPRILFDAESARWFLSGLAFDPNFNSRVFIAASMTSDPAGPWNKYPLAIASGVLHDQPMVGVSSDKVVLSWNDYTSVSTFTGAETWVLEKSDLLAGVAVPRAAAFGPDMTRFRLVPAHSLTPTTTAWLVYNNSNCSVGCNTGSPTVGVVAITGTPAGNNVVPTETDLAIAPTATPPNPQQPGGTPVVSAIDDRFLSAMWQNGTLWVSGNDACAQPGDIAMRSCMKFVALSTKGASPTVSQDFTGGSTGTDFYFPAVTLNSAGDLFVAYTFSSPNIFPTAAASDVRAATPGTFENAITLAVGLGPHSTSGIEKRFGDYSAAAPDPSNPADVWVTAEYQASATDPTDWGTATARVTIPPSAFTPTTPQRLLDTRNTGGRMGPAGNLSLTVAGGVVGAPAGASAVVLNVTVTNATAASYLTAYPAGSPRPLASNLNWVAGQTVPNLVTVPVGANHQVTFFNPFGSVDLVVDLEGYFANPNGAAGGFLPLVPARVLDTRTGNGAPAAKLGPARTLNMQATGQGGVPLSGVSAVVINVTATNPSAAGYLTIYPAGAATPLASNLNFTAGETVPNRVIVGVGTGGQVSIFNGFGSTDVIADVSGYFTDASATGQLFRPLAPFRLLDTRASAQTLGQSGNVNVSMAQAVPAGAPAVILNVTATQTTAASFFIVYPTGAAPPLASDLNWVAGATVPNLVVVKLGSGSASIFNQFGSADAVADIFGYFTPLNGSGPSTGHVIASPTSLLANGTSTSMVTATIMQSDGSPAVNDSVSFLTSGGASCGTIAGSPALTNASGNATVTYTASTTAGTCVITATEAVNSLSAAVTITQTMVANTITVTATPNVVPADGTTSSITSTVTNQITGAVSGDVVTYNLAPSPAGSCGTLSSLSATTDASGHAQAVAYTASNSPGVCTINATESGTGSTISTTITQT